MTTLINAQQLTRYYGKHLAVDNVSFELKKGEILGFLGSNGAGKTTTLQMLCGNLAPSSGAITINGVDLLQQPKLAKQGLGYVPDTPPLYKELTVQEFLRYCAQLHGVAKADITAAVELAKSRCGLTEVAERLIGNLSKGYQQRIGIAQAIVHNPDVIVLDEPTVGLDPLQIIEIRALIRELGQEHAIIFSTHILSEVQEVCTNVLIIRQGACVLNAKIAELSSEKSLETVFIELMQTPLPETVEVLKTSKV
jgi:ABC-2 type transport system ATP-binding protein